MIGLLMEDRIKNIREHEVILDRSNDLLGQLEIVADNWEELLIDFLKLKEYYQSEQWIEDYESSNKGEFPPIKCGVLSQDEVYNALSRWRELSIKLMKLAIESIE